MSESGFLRDDPICRIGGKMDRSIFKDIRGTSMRKNADLFEKSCESWYSIEQRQINKLIESITKRKVKGYHTKY